MPKTICEPGLGKLKCSGAATGHIRSPKNSTESPATDPQYLRPTRFLDSDHPRVETFARTSTEGATSERERAVRLFYAVRDGIRYDPYTTDLAPTTFRASEVLQRESTFCIPKAILLAASARALDIPLDDLRD